MRRVALRGIRAHLVRFVLSVLAVTLGVAFVTGSFSLRTMMSSTFSGIVDSSMRADAYVHGRATTPASDAGSTASTVRNQIPASLAVDLARVDGVAHAFPVYSGPIVLVGADGTAVSSTQAPSFATGFEPTEEVASVTAGRAPAGPNEIALESVTLASSGLSVGDSTTVVLAGGLRTVRVVGDVSMGVPMAGATIVFLDVPTAAAAFAPDGQVESIKVYAEPGVDESTLVDRLTPALAASATNATAPSEAATGDSMRAEQRAGIETTLGFVETFMLIFAAISLFVCAFIIANTFSMSVRQRMREFALLRAIGASPLQVFASILVQAAVVGLAGSVLGIAAGVGLVSLLRIGFEQAGMSLSGAIPLTEPTIITALLVGTLVSVAAAALPARRAALIAPVEAMRDDVGSNERSLRFRAIAGSALVALGAGCLGFALLRAADGAQLLAFGAGGLILGMLVLAPVIARYSLGVLSWVFVVAFRPMGRLARGNVSRNPRRTANTAGALMIGMALVGGVSVLAASATASTQAIVRDGWNADFSVQSAAGTVPGGVVAPIRDLGSVASVDVLSYGPALVVHPGAADDSLYVVGMPPEAFDRTLTIHVVSGRLDTLASGEVAVQKSAAEERGWALGDPLTFTVAAGSGTHQETAAIGAIVDTRIIGTPIIMSEARFSEIVPPATAMIDTLLIESAPGASAAAVRADLVSVVKPYVVLSVLDAADFAAQLAGQVDQMLVVLYALLALSIVIAVLGIVNTLALSVIERTREIGLMRAVGLGRLQLATIITIESVLTALFGTVVGMVVGVGVASAMPTVFTGIGLTELAIPWAQLVGMLVLAAGVGVLAALWPAVRAARLPVLQAVASD